MFFLPGAVSQLIYFCSCLRSVAKLKWLQLHQKPWASFLVAVNKIADHLLRVTPQQEIWKCLYKPCYVVSGGETELQKMK